MIQKVNLEIEVHISQLYVHNLIYVVRTTIEIKVVHIISVASGRSITTNLSKLSFSVHSDSIGIICIKKSTFFGLRGGGSEVRVYVPGKVEFFLRPPLFAWFIVLVLSLVNWPEVNELCGICCQLLFFAAGRSYA